MSSLIYTLALILLATVSTISASESEPTKVTATFSVPTSTSQNDNSLQALKENLTRRGENRTNEMGKKEMIRDRIGFRRANLARKALMPATVARSNSGESGEKIESILKETSQDQEGVENVLSSVYKEVDNQLSIIEPRTQREFNDIKIELRRLNVEKAVIEKELALRRSRPDTSSTSGNSNNNNKEGYVAPWDSDIELLYHEKNIIDAKIKLKEQIVSAYYERFA